MSDDKHRMQTFADHLIHFAQSIDIVPEAVYFEVLQLIQDYLAEQLKAVFFAVAVEKVVTLQPYLVGEWPRHRIWWNKRVKNDQGIYKGQTSLAYALGKPLWIVGANRAPLNKATSWEDLLDNAPPADIPKYEQIEPSDARTSIILPLRLEDRHFGIVNIESSEYLVPSEAWQSELSKVVNAIAILHQLKMMNDLQTTSTLKAKDRLEHVEYVPVVKKRLMFFASSARADDQVVGILNEVLSAYTKHFDVVSWTDPAFGNIHENIWERISTCMYGACYLSEPAAAGDHYRFRDNPNVLFEAGMLFALLKARRSPLQGILLVRESNAPVIPFDLAAEFMALVPRTPEGQLNVHSFRSQLNKHLSFLLKISSAS
jgi:hypothetical protein